MNLHFVNLQTSYKVLMNDISSDTWLIMIKDCTRKHFMELRLITTFVIWQIEFV